MAKIDLIAKAKALPPVKSRRSWKAKLPQDVQDAIHNFAVAFRSGQFQQQFGNSGKAAARWLKEELKLTITVDTIAQEFTGEPDGPNR